MVDDDPQRRSVLKGTAVAALASLAGAPASAQEIDGDADAEAGAGTDVDHEQAAEMLREFYDGYLEGISHAVATDVHMEASMIEDENDEPWPLAVWDDVEDARSEGITLGANEGGSQPFWDEYSSFDREYDGSSGSDGDGTAEGPIGIERLETNAPVDTGETLEVTATLEPEGDAATGTADLDLAIGESRTIVDSRSTTVEGSETVTLTFETATVRNTQTFPVRVDGGDDAAETTVEVVGTSDL